MLVFAEMIWWGLGSFVKCCWYDTGVFLLLLQFFGCLRMSSTVVRVCCAIKSGEYVLFCRYWKMVGYFSLLHEGFSIKPGGSSEIVSDLSISDDDFVLRKGLFSIEIVCNL